VGLLGRACSTPTVHYLPSRRVIGILLPEKTDLTLNFGRINLYEFLLVRGYRIRRPIGIVMAEALEVADYR